MRIAIGSDHAGFRLKESLKPVLARAGVEVEDFGTSSDEPVDYPDVAARVGASVAAGRFDRAILVCGSGIGMSIAANKVDGVRAALAADVEGARLGREHNDANVLALGGRFTPPDRAADIVETFLRTPFAGGRHQRRVDKISAIEHSDGRCAEGRARD